MTQRKSDLSKEIKACTKTYSAAKAAFTNNLTLPCQQIFTNTSNLRTANSSISTLLKTIKLPVYKHTLIPYYVLDQNVQKTEEIIGKLSVLGLMSLYSPEKYLREQTVIGSFLTILSAHCSPQQLDDPAVKETFESLDFDMHPQKISLYQLDQYFSQKLNAFVSYSALQPYHKDFYKFAITIGLSTLLFLGSSVSPESFNDYLNDKWQTLATHIGSEKLTARKLDEERCNFIHGFFWTCRRTAIFELYRSLARQQSNKFKTAFEFIVESLKWADMERIYLFDKYIVKSNPELLSMYDSYFGSEKDCMKVVYELMELLPQNDHPYLKLLLPYSQLTEINFWEFRLLYGAARAVASIYDRNISYVDHRQDTGYVIDIKNCIRNYVLNKGTRG